MSESLANVTPARGKASDRGLLTAGRVRRAALGLLVALGGPGLVTLLAFADLGPTAPALLYVVVIAAAATTSGRWFGLLASIASFVPFTYYFLTPHAHDMLDADSIVALIVFVLTVVFASEAIERERRSRARLADASARAAGAAGRAERLAGVAAALAEALTPQQVLDAVLTVGVAAADARAGLIAMVTEDGEELEIVASHGYDRVYIDPFARFPIEADFPLSEAVRTGRGVFLHSEQERDRRYPELAGRSQPGHALVCLPLVVERGTIGGLVFSFQTDETFPPERREFKVALARQAAVAVERARLLEAERLLSERLAFVGEASEILSSSLEYQETLARLARLAVPGLADWCLIDVLDEDGRPEEPLLMHQDPARVRWAAEYRRRFPLHPDSAVWKVIRSGEPRFVPEVTDEMVTAAADQTITEEVLEQLELRSWICVPLASGGRSFGALTLVRGEAGRRFDRTHLETALDLASRAAVAIEHARLYQQAERRADAALALEYVGDGVILLDEEGRVRYWNQACAAITGVPEREALGRPVAETLPAWDEVVALVPLASADAPAGARPTTVPAAIGGEERWLAVAGVSFDEGVVYAVRDVTDEQVLERTRSDFVATASHELRTPLAAVYGAARTLRRTDVQIPEEQREAFLEMIEAETERLNVIVAQILVSSQLDADSISVAASECDLHELAASVLASTRVRADAGIELRLEACDAPRIAVADEDKLRQVLVNLVDNAVKYSPDGGEVVVALDAVDGRARLAVRDRGLGIPHGEQTRIFEKFYRLDPALSRGVGGSGLGLYISRELVERMGGSLHVESAPGEGSTFTVELPLAQQAGNGGS